MKRLLERFLSSDREGPFDHYADGVEFDARHLPDGRVYRGHDGVRSFLRSYFDVVADYRLEVHGIVEAGDEVMVFARETGRGRSSGAAFDVSCAQIYTLRGGKIVRWRMGPRIGAPQRSGGASDETIGRRPRRA